MTGLLEGIGIALESLRASKVRAALTILGVSIGVMVVMVMASMVRGVNSGVAELLEELGPRTFFVFRFFQGGVVISDGTNQPWRRNPPLNEEEAARLQDLTSIAAVVVSENTTTSVEYEGRAVASVNVQGQGYRWPEVSGGDIVPGRPYTALEDQSNARVVVVNRALAEELFGQLDPVGKRTRIGGEHFSVIGVYNPPPDIFGSQNSPTAYISHGAFEKYVPHFRGWMNFMVKPVESVTVQQAIDDATSTLRSIRGLRPAEENTFAIVTQDRLLENFNQVTGIFFLVMIVLSSVGLMVGGVGVVAIMMISVTERTREIGVRKALGAKKREILWQFMIEAVTLTVVGGAIGMVLGGAIAFLVNHATPLPAEVPLWSIVVALGAAVLTGVGFGLYPAARAARMNPVDALRYE